MFFTVRFGTSTVDHGVLFFNWITASNFYENINVDGENITFKMLVDDNGMVYTSRSYVKRKDR